MMLMKVTSRIISQGEKVGVEVCGCVVFYHLEKIQVLT